MTKSALDAGWLMCKMMLENSSHQAGVFFEEDELALYKPDKHVWQQESLPFRVERMSPTGGQRVAR